MALGSPITVRIENEPGSLGEIMTEIRTWLDHRKIQPASFKPAKTGIGFEIAFNREDEAFLFEREFASRSSKQAVR